VEHDFATIGRRVMLLNARRIEQPWGKARIILLAFEDITERRHLEEMLEGSEMRYRRLFETASDGMASSFSKKARALSSTPIRPSRNSLVIPKRIISARN
jgi:hypothetical protein